MVFMTVCTMSSTVVAVMTVMVRWCKEGLSVVPSHIAENAVLDVTSEKSLFAEGCGVLLGVYSPAHVSSEEEGSLISCLNLLVN